MKLVFVSPFMRVPPDFGLAIRNYHLLNRLTDNHEVVFITHETEPQDGLLEWAKERMAEFVSLGPYPMQIARSNSRTAVRRVMETVPSSFLRARPEYQASVIRDVLERHPDAALVILDTHLAAQTALHLHLDVPCIGVLHDVMSNQSRRQFETTGLRPYKIIYGLDWAKTHRYERRIIRGFQHIATMSEADAKWVRSQNPRARVFVSPNGVDTNVFAPHAKPHSPQNILLAGNFAYAPNEDAFFYLADQILPLIHSEFPAVKVTAVGLDPTERMRARARENKRIEVTGSVPDVRPYYQASDVAVIPLRLGSGTKLKVLEAMSMGVPVVTTSVGIEGINAEPGRDILVADDPAAIADGVLRLLREPIEASRIVEQARIIAKKYDWMELALEFEQSLIEIADGGASGSKS